MFAPGVDGFRAALALQVELEQLVHEAVDVHDFYTLPVDLRFRVLDEGTVIVDRDPKARVRREVATMFAYYDFRPYLDRIRAAARQRLAAGARHA